MKFFAAFLVVTGLLFGAALGLKSNSARHQAESVVELKAPGVSVPVNTEAANIKGRPQTAVVVTQCDALVVAYLTMASGELVRFDKDSGLPWETVLEMAYAATRSERVEVNCEGGGIEGYESHTPEPKTNI